MTHNNFYILKAKDSRELGFLTGKKFAPRIKAIIARESQKPDWNEKTAKAGNYLKITEEYFPRLTEEMKECAKGADIDFKHLWALSMENEASRTTGQDKCTTIITNNGLLVAHNEDWEESAENDICLVLKEIGDLKILELRYYHTLGGDSVGINSKGFIAAVNSLYHSDAQIGVSRNIIARWLSETKNPETDFKKLKKIPRAAGYSHNITDLSGKIWNFECTAKKAVLTRPTAPFIHTNHYLSELKSIEANDGSSGTRERYQAALQKTKPAMTIKELTELVGDTSNGDNRSIMNKRTVARIIIDADKLIASVWLRREKEKGWINYDLRRLLCLP